MFVLMLVKHVTVLPPGLPVPLHWFTWIGIAGLTEDAGRIEQLMMPPPPLAEPLHCVIVALVVVADGGSQVLFPPPPWLEPTH